MLFTLSYQQGSNEELRLNFSGSNMSEVILYCDANNLTPTIVARQNFTVLLNNPSLTECYLVTLKDTQTAATSNTVIYDTYSNVESWINSQSNKVVTNLALQNRPFVQG